MADYTINDFQGENGWSNKLMGGKPLSRFNRDAKIADGILTTIDGKRSVYLNLPGEYKAGKVEVNAKISSVDRGVGVILSCGTDGRNPLEAFSVDDLNDTVILNLDVKHNNAYYCDAKVGRGDVNILRQLNDDEVKFKSDIWYDVQITLDYDKLNAAEDKDTVEWIHFSMVEEGGDTFVDTDLTHLSQAVVPYLRQIRIVCKYGTKIKDFSITSDTEPTMPIGASRLAPLAAAPEPVIDEQPLVDIPDEEARTRLSRQVVITEQEIQIPKYVLKVNDEYIAHTDADRLLTERRSRYNEAVYRYRRETEAKYLSTAELQSYRFGSEMHGVDSIITTNDFADRDFLISQGYKPIYIGNESAVRDYTIDYGTYTGRNTHVIPQNDYTRCQYIVKDTDNMNEVLDGIFAKYPDTPLVITFMDGEYKFHITNGEGTEDNPYKVLALTRDDICFRTFDYNTNFTLVEEDKAKVQNGEKLSFIDGTTTIFGLNFFLEDMVYDEQIYKFPEVAADLQEIIDYVNSLDSYPGIVTVNKWLSEGLPPEVTENIALQDALFELAQLVSDLKGGEA